MSLDIILIISFAGIFTGLLLYLFSSDKQIINLYFKVVNKLKFDDFPKTDFTEFKLSIFTIAMDCIIFLMILGLAYSVVKEEIKIYQIIILAVLFLIPVIIWNQSVGQKLLHIKVLKLSGFTNTNSLLFLLRYILHIILLPLNILLYLKYKVLIHNVIFKTYEIQE